MLEATKGICENAENGNIDVSHKSHVAIIYNVNIYNLKKNNFQWLGAEQSGVENCKSVSQIDLYN